MQNLPHILMSILFFVSLPIFGTGPKGSDINPMKKKTDLNQSKFKELMDGEVKKDKFKKYMEGELKKKKKNEEETLGEGDDSSAENEDFGGGVGSLACKDKNDKQSRCGQCEQDLINEVDSLLSNVESNPGNFKTIEDVLGKLPEKLRTDVVYMGVSQSIQLGERYLMKSPGSEVVLAFNGHEEMNGGKSVEGMKFNGKTGTFEFFDITIENGAAKVTKSPERCVKCHGEGKRTRPIFDPYRFWSNQIPPAQDTLVAGTQDAKDYLEFLEKIKTNPRFAHLKPSLALNDPEKIKVALETNGSYRLKTQPQTPGSTSSMSDGPGVRLFDEMYLNNHCRLNNLLSDPKENPSFETLKFALAAAINGCIDSPSDLNGFVPPEFMQKAQEYFGKKGISSGTPLDTYTKVFDHTKQKQDEYFKDRVGRKLWLLEERYRSQGLSDQEAYQKAKTDLEKTQISTGSVQDLEASVNMFAPMRYLLEPVGFSMNDMSISVDPMSYTFGDFFFNIGNFEPLRSLKKNTCEELSTLSLKAFTEDKDKAVLTRVQAECDKNLPSFGSQLTSIQEALNAAGSQEALEKKRAELRPKVKEILGDNACKSCHVKNSSKGAPDLPFDPNQMKEFEDLLTKTSGELGDWRSRIWERVARPEGSPGQMPPGMAMSDEEKATLKDYFETFAGSGRPENEKARLNGRQLDAQDSKKGGSSF